MFKPHLPPSVARLLDGRNTGSILRHRYFSRISRNWRTNWERFQQPAAGTLRRAFSAPTLFVGPPFRATSLAELSRHIDIASVRGTMSCRLLSTRGGRHGDNHSRRGFKLDALPFTVSPEEALREFHLWAEEDQGLRFFLSRKSVSISAAFVPVWSFDLNVRFATTGPDGRRRYDRKPSPFSAYGHDVCHIPGLSAYSGHTFRRSLVDPVHNTSLVFLGGQAVPFGSWMLRDMKLSDGRRIEVFPDPWNATRGRAFAVVSDELKRLAEGDAGRIGECDVQTEILSARRVYMPTYVIDYKILGMEYRAFASGCDSASGVSGVDYRAIPFSSDTIQVASNSFLSMGQNVARIGTIMGVGPLFAAMNFLLNIAVKVLSRFHIVGVVGAGFVAFRKIIKPWMDNRSASVEWERQREHEAYMQDYWDHVDDFVDSGSARRYFKRQREQILRHLSGEKIHEGGDYGWYKQWEEWARRQWEQQEKVYEQQQRAYADQRGRNYKWKGQKEKHHQAKQGQKRVHKKESKEFVWDFDRNDPYAVLGVKRDATKQEISAAFRREMLKHHPDTQGNKVTDAERERSLERSKLTTDAYRKVKAEIK